MAARSGDEVAARERLPAHVADYYAAGAGSGQTLSESEAAWSAVRFRPRSLRDVSRVDTSTTVLGERLAMPVMVAPMAQQVAAHPDGEAATARAVARASTLLGVSTHAGVTFADVAATGAPWWFQVYVMRERRLTERLVRRAVDAGARALILTVDMVALLPSAVNPRDWPEGPAKARLANLTPAERASSSPGGLETDPATTFDDIGWLAGLSGLPVLVKGIVRGDDAAACLDAGAAGVVVSTHGGRRMGASVSSADVLGEVVDAVGDRGEVYADSGIRTAEQVAAALALGARAVFVGRPVLWALAARGEDGVAAVLDGLRADLAQVLIQLGVASVRELGRDMIADRGTLRQ